MYFQFLIEDQSSAVLIEILMRKLNASDETLEFSCKAFKGIGGLTKKNTVKETKTGKLLNDLATYLRGFNRSLQGIPAAVVVVLDNDTRDPEEFQQTLENVAQKNGIDIDYLFCIAVEEVEAWLLGDAKAVLEAYPDARIQLLQSYEQDSICGTWEKLADIVYPGGYTRMKKERQSFVEIGECKYEWAKKIGTYMDLDKNQSPSFQHFIREIKKRLAA